MGQNNAAGSILQVLLGWIQSLFNSVWMLFNGGSGGSLIRWLSQRWFSLLIIFLIIGVVMDIFIYLVRWKPYWWWFRKKRMVIEDDIFETKPAFKKNKSSGIKTTAKPSTYIPKRVRKYEREDMLLEDDTIFSVKPKRAKAVFEDDSIFSTKPKKTKNVFEVERRSTAHDARRTARR